MQDNQSSTISNNVMGWYSKERRELPWRRTKEPYFIWLSEIILQQTRVNQGLPYFESFVEKFPTVQALAEAPEDVVLKTWEGLGYYSRARNLHKTAKIVHAEHQGLFPGSYQKLLQLPGVGPYTAAAVASIAFEEPVPVLDGNVYRVISRLFNVQDDISLHKSREVFMGILHELIPKKGAGNFNQGLMELGAMICTPQKPKCDSCPVFNFCLSRMAGNMESLPVKTKKPAVRSRYFQYLVFIHNGMVAMRQRTSKDIWQGLYDFHLIESKEFHLDDFLDSSAVEEHSVSEVFKHVLTHQRIQAVFHQIVLSSRQSFETLLSKYKLQEYSKEHLVPLPKPKLLVNYLASF